MFNLRLIARMDIKGPHLIKGVHLEGLRKIGDPQDYAQRYYQAGADELLYMDIVASLYGRNNLTDIVRRTAENVFIPLTVGGGIRSIADVDLLLRSGADKVAVNTAAHARPELLSEIANRFGSQCLVLSIEAKRDSKGSWEAYTDNGREHTGHDAVAWARYAATLGVGEILVTSVDREGTRRGFDVDLVRAITQSVSIPVIASGGMGSIDHMLEVVEQGGADAVAMADILHYNRQSLPAIREAGRLHGLPVREVPAA